MARTLLQHREETLSPPVVLSKEASTMPQRRILIAEDNEANRTLLKEFLAGDSLQVDTVANGSAALEALVENNYSIVITDMKMPHVGGMELIEEVRKRGLAVTVIVTTAFGVIDEAVQAMRLGAYDFLTKPYDVNRLRLVVDRALRERKLQDEVVYLREQLESRFSFHNILSKNPAMHAIFELINNVADTTTTVLIEGETGTGKEQVARAIHQTSQVRSGPMIAVNCAALPENLLESELFGHEKGAFTSAVGQRRGRFELADGGTIFLDEVGDIPAAMQAKLLRVLQERRFERVGGTESLEVDVRVIAATNRSLLKLVKQKTFREDLFYRLNVVKIDLPPLRERSEDIPLLATHFAVKYARNGDLPKPVSPEAMELLLRYRWPGNIRELENAIERACVTSREPQILPQDLPPELTDANAPRTPLSIDLERPLPDILRNACADIEREYLKKALRKTHGNIGRCAKICGLSRRSISAKIGEYQINKKAFKEF
jgi:DNA-binding NtrC family response regulator